MTTSPFYMQYDITESISTFSRRRNYVNMSRFNVNPTGGKVFE